MLSSRVIILWGLSHKGFVLYLAFSLVWGFTLYSQNNKKQIKPILSYFQHREEESSHSEASLEHSVLNKDCFQEKLVDQSLTNLGEGQYPTSTPSGLSVSANVGSSVGLRSVLKVTVQWQRLTESLYYNLRTVIHFLPPHQWHSRLETRIQGKNCTFQTLFKKTSRGKSSDNRETKTRTGEDLIASDTSSYSRAQLNWSPGKRKTSH